MTPSRIRIGIGYRHYGGDPLEVVSPGPGGQDDFGGGDTGSPPGPIVDDPVNGWTQVSGSFEVNQQGELEISHAVDNQRIIWNPAGPAGLLVSEVDLAFPNSTALTLGVLGVWNVAADTGYLVEVGKSGAGAAIIKLFKRTGGVYSQITSTGGLALDPGVMYHLKTLLSDGRQLAWVNDVLVIDQADRTFAGQIGKAGLRTGGSNAALKSRWDNWKVYLSNTVIVRGLPSGYRIRIGGKTSNPVV